MTPILVEKLGAIDIGRQGENLARTVQIDVSSLLAQWPDAMITLLVKRKGDAEPYFAETTLVGNILYWPITSGETANAGDGKIEIQAVSGEVIAKSVTGTIRVSTSLSGTASDDLPDTHPGWVDEVLEAAGMIAAQAEELESTTEEARETITTLTSTVDAAVAQAEVDTASAVDAANKATADAIAATVQLALTAAPAIECEASGDIISISDGAERPAVSLVSYIDPVQEGSGDPSPDNVRPISGWNSVAAHRRGQNMIGYDADYTYNYVGGMSLSGVKGTSEFYLSGTQSYNESGYVCNAYPMAAGTYAFAVDGLNQGDYINIGKMKNGEYVEAKYFIYSTTGVVSFELEEATNVRIQLVVLANSTYTKTTIAMSCTVGDSLPQESYQSTKTITATLPETIYAGILDWNTGILTKYNRVVYDGITAGMKVDSTDPNVINYTHPYAYSRAFGTETNGALAVNKMKILTPQNTPNYIQSANEGVIATTVVSIKMSRERIGWVEGDTTTDIINKINAVLHQWYLDGEPLEVVYVPVKPTTVQLSPQQLETLKGTNNVWSSTGKTELTYIADAKMYIDNRLSAIAAASLNT